MGWRDALPPAGWLPRSSQLACLPASLRGGCSTELEPCLLTTTITIITIKLSSLNPFNPSRTVVPIATPVRHPIKLPSLSSSRTAVPHRPTSSPSTRHPSNPSRTVVPRRYSSSPPPSRPIGLHASASLSSDQPHSHPSARPRLLSTHDVASTLQRRRNRQIVARRLLYCLQYPAISPAQPTGAPSPQDGKRAIPRIGQLLLVLVSHSYRRVSLP